MCRYFERVPTQPFPQSCPTPRQPHIRVLLPSQVATECTQQLPLLTHTLCLPVHTNRKYPSLDSLLYEIIYYLLNRPRGIVDDIQIEIHPFPQLLNCAPFLFWL